MATKGKKYGSWEYKKEPPLPPEAFADDPNEGWLSDKELKDRGIDLSINKNSDFLKNANPTPFPRGKLPAEKGKIKDADDWEELSSSSNADDWESNDWEESSAPMVGADDIYSGPGGDLGMLDRARLSFASNKKEKDAYLKKLYPDIELGETGTGMEVFRRPEENERFNDKWRPLNNPDPQGKDIADFAGDLPVAIGGGAGAVGGFALGGPFGAVGGGAAGGYLGTKAKRGIKDFLGIPDYQSEEEKNIESGVNTVMGGIGGAIEGKVAGKMGKAESSAARVEKPTVKNIVAEYKDRVAKGLAPNPPSLERLDEIERLVPDMKRKPLNLHRESLKSKSNFRVNDLRKNLPSEEADAIQFHEQEMKREATEKLRATAESAAKRPLKNKIEAGQDITKKALDTYESNKQELVPVFEMLKQSRIPVNATTNDILSIARALQEAHPRLTKNVELTSGGPQGYRFKLKPFDSTMGISSEAYGSLKQTIKDLNKPNLNFEDLQNMRDYLRKQLNQQDPKKTAELDGLRKGLLRFMEQKAEQLSPLPQKDIVRSTFQRYAKNEAALQDFEHIIGGKLDDYGYKKLPKDEAIVSRMFNSTKSVKRSQEILGPDATAAAAGDWVNHAIEDATNSATGQISSAKLNNFLRKNEDKLRMAVGDAGYDRMLALNDLIRLVPDAPSANPSGTSYQVLSALGKGRILKAGKGMLDNVLEGNRQSKASKELDAIQKGKSYPPGLINKAKRAIKSPVGRGAAIGGTQSQIDNYINDRLKGRPVEEP